MIKALVFDFSRVILLTEDQADSLVGLYEKTIQSGDYLFEDLKGLFPI